MGVVSRPGYSDDDMWLRATRDARFAMSGVPEFTDHRTGVRVGVLGMQMQCLTCGTICMPHHEPFILTEKATGETRTITGAWVGPPDDPYGHFFPFGESIATSSVNTDERSATEDKPPKPLPAGISAAAVAKGRSRDTPSRSPEARHEEYVRATRREAR